MSGKVVEMTKKTKNLIRPLRKRILKNRNLKNKKKKTKKRNVSH